MTLNKIARVNGAISEQVPPFYEIGSSLLNFR